MTKEEIAERKFRPARQEAADARKTVETPQTMSAAYRLAFQDTEFLLREDLRPIRFQLELLKPQLLMDEARIESTFVFYGSARIPQPEEAQARIDAAATPEQKRIAENLAKKARYYDEARKLARIAAAYPANPAGCRHFVVCSGGGPSIMEAANRGAADVGAQTIGMNIVLPHEQSPNRFVTPELSFQFHYFALRKMHFLLRARALAVFPGGFGTFDEFFELLTLIQTGKMKPIPILLFGKDFWTRVVNFEALADEGVIAPSDLNLITWVETAEEAWAAVEAFYEDMEAPGCD
ncbi:LOG family protein [Sphingobium cloacae]|uniref:AMP nucleosidase n=1 Tax=Sphingobium cloacae TaxID=120107 RepID=A0A1E1F4J2_9SPHN|nr:LOG family protein [Sphingobium cloacae]BAV65417.1 lysine decarboxylase [Sphingobium cloacae]